MDRQKVLKVFYILLIYFLFTRHMNGFEIKFLEKFELSQEKKLIAYPISLCVTEDELFLISDMKQGHVKMYNNKGNLLKIIGGKGFGPNEFTRAGYSFYDERKFGVYDMDAWRIHLYEREGKFNFKRVKSIACYTGITDAHIKGNKIFMAGYRIGNDSQEYNFFCIDGESGKSEFLIPIYYSYGFSSYSEYKSNRNSPVINMVGGMNKFDIAKDSAYYIWEGKLNITRISLTGSKITQFGRKTDNYIPPFISAEILNSYNSRYSNANAYGKARGKMSFVDKIFACNDYVMVIYRGPARNETLLPYTAQFYTLEGNFINELRLPTFNYAMPFFLDKEKNILYAVTEGEGEAEEEKYFVVKIQISKSEPK